MTNVIDSDTIHYPQVDADWGIEADNKIPAEVVERLGSADVDTAGGCG